LDKAALGKSIGYTFLVVLWLAWEYFYFDAEISWPWLVLGNGFAKDIRLVQWIEYTGILGLSLWVWLVNLLLLGYTKAAIWFQPDSMKINKRFIYHIIFFVCLVFVPVAVSLFRFYTCEEKENPCQVVVVQPNIDPYRDKFGGLSPEHQLDILLTLSETAIDADTRYLIAPETAVSGIVENNIRSDRTVRRMRDFIAPYPKLNIIVGMSSFYIYENNEKPNYTARKMDYGYYDAYNAALQVNHENDFQVYHKSKLVIGVEKLPYPELMGFLSDWSIDLGGITGTLAIDKDRHVFTVPGSPFRTGVAICYESVYGRFFTEYIKKGANLMFIITNDGWWDNTPGYKQHLSYASLRAIETRRSIARSANTGISAFINQRGEITERTEWWTPAVLKTNLNVNDELTFYVINGDYIGRLSCFVLLLLSCVTIVGILRGKTNNTHIP
jgi:apolipoprotein N-acyltransferase